MFLSPGWPPAGMESIFHVITPAHVWTSYVGPTVRISALTQASPAPCILRRSNRLRSMPMFSHIGIHLGVPKDWKSFKYPTGSRWLRRSFKVGNSRAQPPDESKEGFGGGGMIVCPRQRAKPLMSLHHERIHYARQGNAALNAEEREAAWCRYITYKVIGAYAAKISTLYGLYKLVVPSRWTL